MLVSQKVTSLISHLGINIVIMNGCTMNVSITAVVVTIISTQPRAAGDSGTSHHGTSQPGSGEGWNGSGAAESRPTSAERRDNDIGTDVVSDASQPQDPVCEPEAENQMIEEEIAVDAPNPDGDVGELDMAEAEGRPPQPLQDADDGVPDPATPGGVRARLPDWAESCQFKRCLRCRRKPDLV